jgi:hypothetical protein
MQTIVHELGHWLLGRPHPYDGTTIFGKHAYWGILCNGNRVASCANAYERERLGWIVVPEIQPDQNVILADYVPSGTAYKYHPANGYPFEYFYIENHQQSSVFDDVTANSEDKGVWVLHQEGPYMEMDNLKIRPSDGYWKWENPGFTTSCFAQPLPVFGRGVPKSFTGVSHRDQIPIQTSLVNWMYVYKDSAGRLNCGAFSRGERFVGAFRSESNLVFSQYSNPTSRTWDNQPTSFSFEILNEVGGTVTVRYNSDPLDAAPARRYLGPDPSQHDTLPGWLYLAWGSQWPEGQPLEPDVILSEVQRRIGSSGNWASVYTGPASSWSDGSMFYDSSGTVPVLFRARVCDTQGRYSAWSNSFYTNIVTPNAVGATASAVSDHHRLEPNYPNPFNPSTTISFNIPHSSLVIVKVYDVLGKEVAVLVNEDLKAGSYAATFDASGLTSGVYFYRLQAGQFVATRKMLIAK